MTGKVPLLAVAAAALALVLSGCDDMSATDDVPTALPHHGTWYFADPVPGVPVPPDARLELEETEFTLAMGDGMEAFTLFDVPGVTRFEVTGTYMIEADGSASFGFPQDPLDAVTLEPDELRVQIAPQVVAAAAALQEDTTVMIMIDVVATPIKVTISGSSLPGLLNLPGVTEVTACKGTPCASS